MASAKANSRIASARFIIRLRAHNYKNLKKPLHLAPTPIHTDVEIETAIIALRREPRGGLLIMPDVFMVRASRIDHIGGGPKQRTGGLFSI